MVILVPSRLSSAKDGVRFVPTAAIERCPLLAEWPRREGGWMKCPTIIDRREPNGSKGTYEGPDPSVTRLPIAHYRPRPIVR